MIHLNEDQKLQVLLAELQERYNASHKIRERSTQFTLWISGMAIGLGWVLISHNALLFSQRVALTILITALFGGTLYFMMGLKRGLRKNREAMIGIERALGMHDLDMYLKDAPLLPTEYAQAKGKWGDHFITLYAWIVLVAMFLLILTLTCPDRVKNLSSKTKIEQIKGGK